MKISKNPEIQWKNWFQAFCTRSSSGNQVEGLPLALSKDAVPARWIRPGPALNSKIYNKMYNVDTEFDVKLLVNHKNLNFSYNKASKKAI